ncbi:unnamed protein product [Cylindrotheca closterium]|uniref:EamA domain-containing protein n=1 Tax=Cylindrotheca closterium TaxID=2856 RepID=A0AAD2PY06_9STRA|nr:unnamed protein product [Cylindrotheca closterium]
MNFKDEEHSSLAASADVVTHTTTVETATLVLPDDTLRRGDEFILQTTSEIAAATSDAPLQQGGHTIHIEGIVDLDELRDLVPGIDEDEFASLLHSHQQDNDDDDDEDNTTLLSTLLNIDEQSHLLGDIESEQQELEDVPVSADAFLETIANAMPPTEVSRANKTQTYETSNQAFLLSIPTNATSTASGEEQTLVLAMPEINESEPLIMEESEVPAGDSNMEGEANEEDDDEYHGFVDMVRQYSEYLPQIPALPTDVQDVELVAHAVIENVPFAEAHTMDKDDYGKDEEEEEQIAHLDLIVERKVPLIGYVILVVGLFALASVGAALDLQEGNITPTMKTYWRLQSTAICIFPIAVLSMAQTPKEKLEEQWSSLTKKDLYFDLPLCAASYAWLSAGFVVALEMTSLANAFVLSNLASLVIIFGKLFLGIKIMFLEGIGASVGLTGALVCALAPTAVAVEATGRMLGTTAGQENLGNGIAFLCSLGLAAYLILAKKLRYKMDLFLFMFMVFSLSSAFLLCYMIMTGEEVQISIDPDVGIFGWMSLAPDRLPLELYMAIVCNIVGTTGYIAVMKYFDPVVITMVMLTEPVVATLLGILAGVEGMPVEQVIVGNAFVILGSIIVIASESKSTESIDATKALTPVEDSSDTTVVRTPKNALHKSTSADTVSTAGTESSPKVVWKPS